ncbi:MAG: AraC family transcriptional regulator [Lachnospiraceae bacterium]|nr:AraC family transcriptional regulator [Lachnospiraceae bacterium]
MQPRYILLTNRHLVDLNPRGGGEEQVIPGRRVGPITRPRVCLHYVLHGKGIYTVRGKTYPVEAGQAFIIYPHEIATYQADIDDPWHYQWLNIEGRLSESFLQLPPVFPLSRKHFQNIFSYMDDLAMREYKIAAQLLLMYSELFSDSHHSNHYVNRVVNYIQIAYMEKITIESIAQQMNLDRRYLSWLFKQKTGKTIQQYLISVRMEQACLYLQEGHSVQETAQLCGYEDVSNFSKMFKQQYGKSPAHWKKQILP